ncbi:MAG: phospholipase D-like domain-containing protein, partial [Steroidobacteraceae bacterium]
MRSARIVAALLALGCALAQGCASLPNARREMAAPHPGKVEFESGQGPVSKERSAAILERLEGEDGYSEVLEKHLAYEQAINADSPLVLGNKVSLLQNGPETYEAMFAAMRAATDSINLETYIFDDDEEGRKFSDLLLERQAAGVQVNVIYDSVGGILTPTSFFDRLRAGGIKVLEFNPVNPLAGRRRGWRLNNRDHRKQLLVDGRIAFTGGINISKTYSSSPAGRRAQRKHRPPVGWRDTHVEIEGPVVAEFQKMFLDTWARQEGDPLAQRNYFPELTPQGTAIVRAIGSKPSDPKSVIYLTLMSAISHAEREVHITMAYFGPDPEMLEALIGAAQRGVDVKLVLPSYSDSAAVFHLGRSYYSKLLRGGVEIYERRGAIMHAKSACIDGVWSTIGSTNIDSRSFLHNDEVNAVILGRDFAAKMAAMFADDVAASDAIVRKRWK